MGHNQILSWCRLQFHVEGELDASTKVVAEFGRASLPHCSSVTFEEQSPPSAW
jgi:hypothetical protein